MPYAGFSRNMRYIYQLVAINLLLTRMTTSFPMIMVIITYQWPPKLDKDKSIQSLLDAILLVLSKNIPIKPSVNMTIQVFSFYECQLYTYWYHPLLLNLCAQKMMTMMHFCYTAGTEAIIIRIPTQPSQHNSHTLYYHFHQPNNRLCTHQNTGQGWFLHPPLRLPLRLFVPLFYKIQWQQQAN